MGDQRSIHALPREHAEFLDSILIAALPVNLDFYILDEIYRASDFIPAIRAKLFHPGIAYTLAEMCAMHCVLEYFLIRADGRPAYSESSDLARHLAQILKNAIDACLEPYRS